MRGCRRWLWMIVVLVTLVAAWPGVVEAAARIVVPNGWGESGAAAPEAQRRASRWQEALGLRLIQVISAPDTDRFAETVAVFERSVPVSELEFADEAAAVAALSAAVANVVGSQAPEDSAMLDGGGGQIVWGRWTVDDLTYECALAPSGSSATIVIAAVLASELPIQRGVLVRVFEQVEGVSAPMPRFSLDHWRIGSIGVWLALALGLHAAMLPFGDRDHDHRQAGMRASGINLALVMLGTGIAVFVLRDRELALAHAGSSVASLAVWIGVSGVIAVGMHFLIAARFDHGRVRSAPSSGAFASGTFSTADVLRSRSGVRPIPDELLESGSWPPPSQSSGRIVVDESERE